MSTVGRLLTVLGLLTAAVYASLGLAAGAATTRPAPTPPTAADSLSQEQQRIVDSYKHLEDVLIRMAEVSAATNPSRAAILKKAIEQSKEQLIGVRLNRLVELLGKEQLSRALENQTEVDQDLRGLLELLLSENRQKHIQSEKARIREYLKRIGAIINQQKDIQGRTAGGDDAPRLADEQGKLSGKTGELARDIQKSESPKAGSKDQDSKGQDSPAGGSPSGKNEQGQQGKGGGSPQPQPDSEKKEAKSPGGDPSQQEQSPEAIRKRLQAAQQHMNDAQAKLKDAQRQGAGEKQEQAILALELARAKLEEILRQLREEEVARVLAMLEARVRKMLAMQEEVYAGTVRLDNVPAAERTHNHEIEASRLSGKESQIVVEMDKALLLLRDDGSAVAMLEAAQQTRDDMQQVVERLAQLKVGKTTQAVEQDILAALKEMADALKKAQKDADAKKKRSSSESGQPQEPPLVEVLSELKMIRALQMRVNTRTARYASMIDGEQADSAELVAAMRQLAVRQQRIYRVTHDLQIGRNQ